MRVLVLACSLLLARVAPAQFAMQDSRSTASLRGVHSLGDGIAWASGSGGTVLRTEDDGSTWQVCSPPPGGEKLDFRGIQGLTAKAAVAMSSGKGELSRIYKTIDGCLTWRLVFTNPDADGFFDAIRRVTGRQMYLLGDPVGGKFAMFYSPDAGDTWFIADDPGLEAEAKDGAFAASNSSLISLGTMLLFGTGGASSAHIYSTYGKCASDAAAGAACPLAWAKENVPLAAGGPASGVFALAGRTTLSTSGKATATLVAVGGTYDKPNDSTSTAAFSIDGGKTWIKAVVSPRGYRSGIAFYPAAQTWIAVGPSGTDLSRDNGKNWTAFSDGSPDAAAATTGWNAISLPFVVGAKGRIGKLRSDVLKP